MIEIQITPGMYDAVKQYEDRTYPQGTSKAKHVGKGTHLSDNRNLSGTLGEMLICKYMEIHAVNYFLQKGKMNWHWDFEFEFGHYDCKTMERKMQPKPFFMHDVTREQVEECQADGYVFCDVTEDYKLGWIVGFCTLPFFKERATLHLAGVPFPTNPKFSYGCDTYDIPVSLLTPPEQLKVVRQTCEFCQHIFCGWHEELTKRGEPIPDPCPRWHKHR